MAESFQSEVGKLQAIEKRAGSLQPEANKLRESMHPNVLNVAGRINIPLLKEVLSLCEYSDISLADDIPNDFEVIGDIKDTFEKWRTGYSQRSKSTPQLSLLEENYCIRQSGARV
ncbi:hypothetical protein FOL47_010312 [Perkinsus chesapeaki]|uniref:Uncharacterized protein n=1 Tax=Perkinsus chesapeaki TaxID=330153 RepID=A0A7J6L2S0_PERCH|nr:hypothetical protein FOL47_010312 [Perkinsus chesapeaki]